MPEFREVPQDDLYDFRTTIGYSFMPEQEPPDPDEDTIKAPMEVGTRYGRYDGDDLLAVCKLLDFQANLRGDTHPMAGVSFVASPPETRRQGHVKEMLADALAVRREDGTYLSALHPFKRTYYERLGWATATRHLRHSLDPDLLSFARDHRMGEFHQLDVEDWERLDPVYEADAAAHELTLDRSEEWWEKRILQGWQKDPYSYGWERDGDLAAYVVYRIDEDDETTLNVTDWAATDHGARLAVLRFLSDHDSQVDEVVFTTAPDDDLLDVIPNADEVETSLELSTMLRLVDVPEALEALAYPADVGGELTLDVTDSLAAWNDDTFRLAVEDGECSVTEATADAADVELDVGTLSQLYAGYRGARELAAVGDIEARETAVDVLTDVFPTTTTYLREGF